MPDPISPMAVFVAAFFLSAFAGLAAVLRSGKDVGWLSVITAFLNSGLFGLGISLVWFTKFQDNIFFLLGVCILSGLNGAAIIDFAIETFKKNGVSLFGVEFDEKK